MAWVATLPKHAIVKDKVTCPREQVDACCRALKASYTDAHIQEGDGLRLGWPVRWLPVWESNTEPNIRFIAEAPNTASARALCDAGVHVIRDASK